MEHGFPCVLQDPVARNSEIGIPSGHCEIQVPVSVQVRGNDPGRGRDHDRELVPRVIQEPTLAVVQIQAIRDLLEVGHVEVLVAVPVEVPDCEGRCMIHGIILRHPRGVTELEHAVAVVDEDAVAALENGLDDVHVIVRVHVHQLCPRPVDGVCDEVRLGVVQEVDLDRLEHERILQGHGQLPRLDEHVHNPGHGPRREDPDYRRGRG